MLTDADRVPLTARAFIGDGATGALVAADGTIDWYCPGRFDAAPTLARLLDPTAGAVRVGPVRTGTSVRRRLPPGGQSYRDASLVLDTEMAAGGARLRVTDFMPWAGPGSTPPGRIVRVATALAGPVEVEVEVIPGGPWGPARVVSGWSEGMVSDRTVVHAGFPLRSDPVDRYHPRWRGVRRLDAGESLVVTVDDGPLGRHPALSVEGALRLADDTVTAWRSWLGPLIYGGTYGAAVRRSAVTVRALTSPFGAPLAAATTSLPRRVGGERSADDRVVRLADAATAVGTWAAVGFPEDAEAAETWVRAAVQHSEPPWPVELDLEGGPAPEREERPLPGWRRSQPVVTGVVPGIVDHDLYGDVVAAVSASRTGPGGGVGGLDGPLVAARAALVAGADWLTDHWHEPDAGRWAGTRAARLVASAVQAWVALDGMTRRAQAANPLDLAVVPWHRARRDVLKWLESDGLGADDGLRRDPAPADRPDAALLRVAWRGPWPTFHPIVVRTVERTIERLESGALLYRLPAEVDDGRGGADNPDLLASLWAVRALARLERWEDAHERMEAILGLAAGAGTLSEAADPTSGELLGNLPSAAVHLAVIDAAVALSAGPR